MSHATAILATFIVTFYLTVVACSDLKKDYVKAGYMLVGDKFYKLTEVDKPTGN